MEPRLSRLRRLLPALAALAPIGILFAASRQPALSDREAREQASHFRFTRLPLPELPGVDPKQIREVHPSLRHISSIVSFVGAAVALADLDGDGLPDDLLSVDPRVDRVIAAPVPGTEERYSPFSLEAKPLSYNRSTMAPMGCLVGGFNEDGGADILVYYWGRSPVVFLRRVEPAQRGPESPAPRRFLPVELVEPYERWYTCAVTQADLDGDGHLDLVVGNYFPDGARILDPSGTGVEELPHSLSRADNGGRNRLFLAEAASSTQAPSHRLFREVPGILADTVAGGWTFAIGAADLDGDLLPEIYFVNDWGPDRLLHNRSRPGSLRFAELHGERTLTTPRSKVLGADSFNGMGMDFGDVNGDGWPDLFVSNITAPFGLHESHFLFLSTGEVDRMRDGIGPYRDASEELGLARSGWAWEARLADFDNDGVLEVMQAAGFTKGTIDRWPEAQELATANDELISSPRTWPRLEPGDAMSGADHNPFFVRANDGRYHDLAPELGLGNPMCSRGIATADVDGDGRLDFALANQWEPSFFFRNTAPDPGAFLGLNLRLPLGPGDDDDGPSRPAIGAVAVVHLPDGRRLTAQVDGGTGHSGKRAPALHFGLGRLESSSLLRVDLRWRDTGGQIRTRTMRLPPGWHTVLLGPTPQGIAGGEP